MKYRFQKMRESAIIIQKYYRTHAQKRRYQNMRVGYMRLQALIRSRVVSHRFKHLRGHIISLQVQWILAWYLHLNIEIGESSNTINAHGLGYNSVHKLGIPLLAALWMYSASLEIKWCFVVLHSFVPHVHSILRTCRVPESELFSLSVQEKIG